MAVMHNGLIRGLNTIYLQAPHVQPSDLPDFIAYCLLWSETLNSHHHGEEINLFPAIEEAAAPDGKGIMDENLKQHGK
jgi:hemerythrin-like domain-containing protein